MNDGYKDVAIEDVKVYHSGQRHGITRGLGSTIKQRSAIESAIGAYAQPQYGRPQDGLTRH